MANVKTNLDIDTGKVKSRIMPPTPEGMDRILDYLFRTMLLVFPLTTGQADAVLGTSGRDILFGMFVLAIAFVSMTGVLREGVIRFSINDKAGMIRLGLFILLFALSCTQLVWHSAEFGHTFLYLLCFGAFFLSAKAVKLERYYLQLFAVGSTLLYLSTFRYIISGAETFLKAERLLKNPIQIVPLLMACVIVGGVLYLTEESSVFRNVYLCYTIPGMILFFLYGDARAFWLLFAVVLLLFLIGDNSKEFLKRNLIFLFLYGLCASNAPLLSNLNLPGLTGAYNLEYSIYIDIVMTLAALFFVSYFEKAGKEDSKDRDCAGLIKWYKRGVVAAFVVILLASLILTLLPTSSSDVAENEISGAAAWLARVIESQQGELWHVAKTYGLIGAAISLMIFALSIRSVIREFGEPGDDYFGRSCLVITVLFAILCVFYPLSSLYIPVCMMAAGVAFNRKNCDMEKTISGPVARQILYMLAAVVAALIVVLTAVWGHSTLVQGIREKKGRVLIEASVDEKSLEGD